MSSKHLLLTGQEQIKMKQVLKVIREQRVAPRRIKRIANYRFRTALDLEG